MESKSDADRGAPAAPGADLQGPAAAGLLAEVRAREEPQQSAILDSKGKVDLDAAPEVVAHTLKVSVSPDYALWGLVMTCYEFLEFVAAATPPPAGTVDLALDTARKTFAEMLFTDPDPAERDANARELAQEILHNFYGAPGTGADLEGIDEDRSRAIFLAFQEGQKVQGEYKRARESAAAGDEAAAGVAAAKRAALLQVVWDQVLRIESCSMKHLAPLGIQARYGLLPDDQRLQSWDFLLRMHEMAMVYHMLRNTPSALSETLMEIFRTPLHEGAPDDATIREQITARVTATVSSSPKLADALQDMIASGAVSMTFLFTVFAMCGPVIPKILEIDARCNLADYIPAASGGGGSAD